MSENQTTFITPEEAVQVIRALRERIPEFTQMDTPEKRQLVRSANIGVGLVHASINAIDASALLRGAVGRDAEELRGETESIGRWSQVLDEHEALRRGIIGAMTIRRHRLGAIALRVYNISQQLARYKENAELLPHIAAMKRAAGFGARRAAKLQGAPAAPPPVPKPQPGSPDTQPQPPSGSPSAPLKT
ncbi:MAG: hypothetical protein ACXW5U_26015 [Thermoanaerobaculia bacterium]